MIQTENYYLKAIQTADREGIQGIYKEYLPRIVRLITNNGGSHDDAEDVFQEAIMIIFEKARAKDFKLTSNFYTLLHGICRNLWGNRLQKKSSKEVTIPDNLKYNTGEDIVGDMQRAEEGKLFWDAFQKLGADCQTLLKLFFEKTSMQQIVEKMGLSSVSYAKKRKFQCKEKLVAFVKEDPRFLELKL